VGTPDIFDDAADDLRQLTSVENDQLVKETNGLLGILRITADIEETDQLFKYCLHGTEDQAETAIVTLHSRADSDQKEQIFKRLICQLVAPKIMSLNNVNFHTVLAVRSCNPS
jgi:hypothetical protein